MTRYYIDLKEYAETADISEVSNETLKEVIKDFLLEAQKRALTIPAVVGQSEQLVCPDCKDGRDPFDPDWLCPECRQKEKAN